MEPAIIGFLIFFTILAWYCFDSAIYLLFFLLPAYLIRFQIGPLPTTVLEVLLWILLIVFFIKNRKSIFSIFYFLFSRHTSLIIAIILFITAAAISAFTSINLHSALGEWKAFYIEPVLIFFILVATIKTKKHVQFLLLTLIASAFITSLLAIGQHFTGWLVPTAFWENRNTYRVTAWYGFPNAVGLFLAPLVPLAIYLLMDNLNELRKKPPASIFYFLFSIFYLLFIPASILAIAFAKSVGGLVGVAAGILTLLLFHKKTRIPSLIAFTSALAIIFFVLPGHSAARQKLLLQDRSGQIRVNMWGEAIAFLHAHPIAGAGLASYQKKIIPYHHQVNGENIEIFHHQHNIFLTMWINLGILGLVAFVLILIWFYRFGLKNTLSPNRYTLNAYLIASMTTLLTTGLVDSPYIKNDLSLFFWLLPALLIINANENFQKLKD